MYEILGLLVLLAWIAFSIWLAARVTRVVRQGASKVLIFLVLAPILSALPLADEIIGKFQFDRLCEEAKDVKIFATKPVGEELYYPDGRWRLSSSPPLPLNESNYRQSIYESLVRYERSELDIIGIAMPISGRETRIFDRKTGQLLASYRIHSTRGGWISRSFEKPIVVKDQCLPESFGAVGQRILPYHKGGDSK
jgi:hypothetical protein